MYENQARVLCVSILAVNRLSSKAQDISLQAELAAQDRKPNSAAADANNDRVALRLSMSIYATLWVLRFPSFGQFYIGPLHDC
ncbi:MAG: hypothetical protein JWM63_4510 [Gammaproteobacteria bacterium]|nr:hypothetical protein [Gammaproteobacteria bacterium]